jgi:sugar lactone lactonase YvrE
VRIAPESGETTVDGDTGGRPLGLHVARDGRLLICDSPRGLLAMDTGTGRFETLADEVDYRKLRFCSNVTETADGTIYFTESTSAFTYADYMAAILEARGRGSLFRRDTDGTVRTLVPGLYFANGLTLTADGSVTAFAEHLPGMPDNLSTGADGRIWCAFVTPANPVADRLARGSPLVRRVLWRLPSRLHPKPESVVWVVAFDSDTGDVVAGLRTEHPGFGQVTGMVEAGGKLWMSSIGGPAVAWAELSGLDL